MSLMYVQKTRTRFTKILDRVTRDFQDGGLTREGFHYTVEFLLHKRLAMANQHISILPESVGNQYPVLQCLLSTCVQCLNAKKSQYHCPLCSLSFAIPSRLKMHYNKVHWNHKVTAQGYNILRCNNECKSVGPKKGEVIIKGAHYHCFGCANLFTRAERAVKHYAIHYHVSGKTDPVVLKSEPLIHQPSLYFAAMQNTKSATLNVQPAVDNFTMAFPNIGPNTSQSLKGSNVERVKCQYCGKSFHPHSMKTHIDSQHSDEARHLVISPYRYHKGVCVDSNNGVFFMRRNLSGPCYPVHVQYCPNGNPPRVLCQLTECQQVMDTAARSGDVGYLCKHLLSVPYIPTQLPSIRPLGSNSLDVLINDIKLLKPRSKMECLEYQLSAIREGVPLIVPLPAETHHQDSSPSRLSFSVWVNQRKRWWSFCSRVSVTFDCQQRIWHCKHVKGFQSCIHKTIVKWYMAEHMPHLVRFAQPTVDEDEADDNRSNENELECGEETEEVLQDPTVPQDQTPCHPPSGELLKQMTSYLYYNKRIPANLPVNLLSETTVYPKRLYPSETTCKFCSGVLSDPVTYTSSGKLLTTGAERLISGIEVFIRTCPVCSLPYRYQEYMDGIHNYNDYWIFSLGVLDLLRQLFKVHTATSRVTEALENWLRLEKGTLPPSVIRNAYLHFEALSDHSYDFSCVLCGYHPPALVLDANKKGAFDLTVSNLDVPDDGCDEVYADAFWENVGFALLVRGFFHSGQSDSQNPYVASVMPNYKFWSPWVGKHTRHSKSLINTEYKKCFYKKNLAERGTQAISLEEVIEILDGGSVKVLRELCQEMNIFSKGSKTDLLRSLKEHLQVPEEFLKVFSKFWGGSGGWLGAACQHGVCYGLKWILRQEGARDHIDLILSLKHQPNVIIVDFASQVTAHGNSRRVGLFSPNDGRVLPDTPENIVLAQNDEISLDMPWIAAPSRSNSLVHQEPERVEETREPHPLTGSASYLSLFDTFHEENSSNPVDLLRRTRCVKQLEGIFRTEVMEQLNNLMNKNNYFINAMSPVNAIFMQRLAIHLTNEKRNSKFITCHEKQLGKSVTLNEDGQIVISSLYQRVLPQEMSNSSCGSDTSQSRSSSANTVPVSESSQAPTVPAQSATPTATATPTTISTPNATPTPTESTSNPLPDTATEAVTSSTQSGIPVNVKMIIVHQGVTELRLPEQYCQSRLLGRSGSNACTIISLLAAMKFLQRMFYCSPSSSANSMIEFIPIMLEGNTLYDSLVSQGDLDVDEAIQVLGLSNTVFVSEYYGVIDIDQFTSLCSKFYSIGGAHIIIIPSGSTVVILAHKDVCLSLFDSHSHGKDGALCFSAPCPKAFVSYVQEFATSASNPAGVVGSNVFSLGLSL